MEGFLFSVIIIGTFGLLMAMYRVNVRLAYYATPNTPWAVTDKINTVGKYLAIAGGLATLPGVILLLFSPDTTNAGFIVNITIAGGIILLLGIPVLLAALIWRTSLSQLSMTAIVKAVFQSIKYKLQPHWRLIAFSATAITLFVILWPLIQILFYLGALAFMGRLGLLDGIDDGAKTSSNDDFYNYLTNKFDHGDQVGMY